MRHPQRSLSGAPPFAARAVSAFRVAIVMLVLFGSTRGLAQDRSFQLKAAFLANFAQYVEWPKEAFASDDAPFVFGVLGSNPFGSVLSDLVAGETINGRKAVVQNYKSADEIRDCHVLFISDSEQFRLPSVLRTLKGRNILTVSDLDGFTTSGGMIRFVTQSRIRFRINLAAARDANLTVSSKLLRLADEVETVKAK